MHTRHFYFLFFLLATSVRAQTPVPGLCPVPLDIPPRPVVDVELQPGGTHITADEQADLIEGGMIHLQGNVEITRDAQQVRADEVEYDQSTEIADFQGNVNYWDNEVYLRSDKAHIELGQDSGLFNNADYRIIETRGRGKADELFLITDKITEGRSVDYTTCDPGDGGWNLTNNAWKISAKDLTLNHETDQGIARHAVLRVKDIPVFYTPYMSFPLSDARKSGFLMPGFGNSNRNGFEFHAPYYWNIAPNMDATITPRLITDSGLMLMGEYRYLFPRGEGYIEAEYLPSDSQFNDDDRSYIALEHRQSFARRGNLYVLFNNVSDERYFEDFGPSLTSTSQSFLQRRADLSFAGDNWNMFARVQDFQTVDESLSVTSRPYKRLPQILFNYYSPKKNNQINYKVRTEGVYFDRGDDPLLNNVNGFRFDITSSVSYPMQTLATYLKPKIGLRYTQYSLEENMTFDDSEDRLLPFVSLDSGVFLEREMTLFDENYQQTLEPRLYYLYVPEEDQSDIPVFDTGVYDFSFNSMFYENRFVGGDRIGDANQVTLSVSSRLFNDIGVELGHISIGQTFYLRDREVILPGQIVQDDTLSPFVAEFATGVFNNLYLRGVLEWDPNENITQKLALQAQYRPSDEKVINLAYRVRQAAQGVTRTEILDVEQTDVSFRWPLMGEWSAVGRWNYALTEKKSLEIFGGIEYNSCCWGLRVVGRRFLSSLDGEFQTGIFMQFELKGLAGVGRKTVDFLSENIPGYRSGF